MLSSNLDACCRSFCLTYIFCLTEQVENIAKCQYLKQSTTCVASPNLHKLWILRWRIGPLPQMLCLTYISTEIIVCSTYFKRGFVFTIRLGRNISLATQRALVLCIILIQHRLDYQFVRYSFRVQVWAHPGHLYWISFFTPLASSR